jgi:hypothetical protein
MPQRDCRGRSGTPHDGDTGEHGWSTLFDHQHQGLDRGLPFRQTASFWEAGYVIGCLPQGDQLAIRQYNWFVELARPTQVMTLLSASRQPD